MIRLAVRSLRSDVGRFAATFVSVLLSTALAAAFASLLETGLLEPMTAPDREILVMLGGVISAWGAIIGTFAPAATLTTVTQRRTRELGLLRELGATSRQIARIVQWETAIVACLGAGIGAAVAIPMGRTLFGIMQDGGIVSVGITHRAGPLSLGVVSGAMVVLAVVVASVAVRRAARRVPLVAGLSVAALLPRWRRLTGYTLLGFGLCGAQSGVAMSYLSDDPYLTMQIAGPAGLLAAGGCATLAPAVLRRSGSTRRYAAGSGIAHLAARNLRVRPQLLAPVLGPVTLLVAGTAGTLMVVGIDARTAAATGSTPEQSESLILLNTAVALMITLFTAILAANAQTAVVTGRAPEFAQLRLAGATPAQVRSLVTREALHVAGLGSILGVLCAILTIAPMSWTRDEGVIPDGQLWLPALVGVGAVGVTVLAARLALATAQARSAGALLATAGGIRMG